MEYREMVRAMESKRRFGSLPGVAVGRKLLAAVGNPQEGLAFIHIAGTNGKGSTAAFLHEILSQAGILTGLFTSPHLVDFTERVKVGGEPIPKEDAARIGQTLLELELGVSPAMFDYALAMALLYFKERGCGIAILETGLGGRLDATSAVGIPAVSVITRIGRDHMSVLGDTLEEIAREKAGILKNGTKAVIGIQEPAALCELLRRCEELRIPRMLADEEEIVSDGDGFFYGGRRYRMRMQGEYQRENAVCAILAARELAKAGHLVTEEAICRGIGRAFWPGRMEIACQDPFLLLDGAHNEDGARAFAKSLSALYPGEKFHFVMGALADKDYRKIADEALFLAERVTTVTPEGERALQAAELAEYINARGVPAKSAADVREVLRPFLEKTPAGRQGIKTAAFGSLHFIGEIRGILQKEAGARHERDRD